MDRLLSIFEPNQQVVEESRYDADKLRFMRSKISIWDFFKISQAGYLVLAVNEKSRMLNQYYNILNTQYFGYGNSFFSLFWNIFFSSGLVCGALPTADWCLFFIGAEGSKCTTLISSPIKDSIKLS